ncbi:MULTISPECIES: hypothetical protein [Methylobacterium]|uniref:hypothetical protein n=1 Tax=Methylobacterium TaxID=407 RepID=UPI000AD8241C|nr:MULTISPECIES: hypothetical protein [Methylobacterium]NGM37403.1 hypothetical protein [Methylobacterium sp. DB0501]UHC20247.1 hypothetical protein LRS73_34850 [Methylobacterium currus]
MIFTASKTFMRYEMLEMMRVIVSGIIADEELALEIEEVALVSDYSGNSRDADMLRVLSNLHRSKAVQLREKLAVVSSKYDKLYGYDRNLD